MKLMLIAAMLATAAGSVQAAEADPAHGKKVFMQCGYCHGVQGQGGAIGPSLKGIVGKKAAQTPTFNYSPALKASGLTWTEANLAAYVAAPQAKVKGTRMVFPGLKKQADVDDVVAYVKSLK